MYFNELQMTEHDTRSAPESENKEFCHLPTSRGSLIIIDFNFPVLTPPKKLWPQKAILGISKKIEFPKNGPTM